MEIIKGKENISVVTKFHRFTGGTWKEVATKAIKWIEKNEEVQLI